jgi:dipeptidyl aminopeptidase/acylaminoacyl peptidase
LNIPKQPGIYPVIVLIRGYVDQNNYQTGVGTKRVGEELAKNGFITLAPDFLGYGESDNPSSDVFEERFQTYTTTLTLLASLKNLNSALLNKGLTDIKADNQIGIWGHSNGGQIALSVLEIAGKNYPTVLWAPVSKPFPYSILYYTDEAEDQGKMLRQKLAQFESNYDVIKYSPNNYYSWIKAPLQIHQGLLDEAVPTAWSDKLVAALEKEKIKVEYCQYKDADHNLMPDGWVTAVDRSVKFFQTRLIINK